MPRDRTTISKLGLLVEGGPIGLRRKESPLRGLPPICGFPSPPVLTRKCFISGMALQCWNLLDSGRSTHLNFVVIVVVVIGVTIANTTTTCVISLFSFMERS